MLDEFVEIMQAIYRSELDLNIYTPTESMIEYRLFKPYSKFEEYISIYIYKSNQTKGLYADHTGVTGDVSRQINLYEVPQTIKEWSNLLIDNQ